MTEFPQRRSTDQTAEIGINAVSRIVNDEIGWIFRRTHEEHDYGIDGYIDQVDDKGGVTGRFIAVQVKCGASYFGKSRAPLVYRGERKHINYLLNQPTPVLLILCEPKTRNCYWEVVQTQKIDLGESSWSCTIPLSNKFSGASKCQIESLFGKPTDHLEELEESRQMTQLLRAGSYVHYCVSKEEVESRSVKELKRFFRRLGLSEPLLRAVQGRLYVTVSGYENDDRELFQIREVKRWAKRARKSIYRWYLCAGVPDGASTLVWLAACTLDIRSSLRHRPGRVPAYYIEFPIEGGLSGMIDECLDGLNRDTETWRWSEAYNKAITGEILRTFHPESTNEIYKILNSKPPFVHPGKW